MSRKKILTFIPYYLPGFKSGGPVRTVSNMIEYMGDEYDFYVVTLDRDLNESESYQHINFDEWNDVGKAKVFYLPFNKLGFNYIRKILRDFDYDVIFLNSFFDKRFTLPVLILKWMCLVPKKPVVISPRGEFSDGAVANKPFIKNIYIYVTRELGVLKNLIWQASALPEYEDIQSKVAVDSEHLFLAQDFPTPFNESFKNKEEVKAANGTLKIIFLSRIAPMKNLLFAIDVLSKLEIPFVFNIYGMIDDVDYWRQCQESIKAKGLEDSIIYKGAVKHEEIFDRLSGHDVFFLPSQGEGYGHAIIEAMTAGLPVLISDRTPWRNLNDAKVGWDISLDSTDEFVSAITNFSKVDDLKRLQQRENVKAYALNLSSSDVLVSNRNLFEKALSKRSP